MSHSLARFTFCWWRLNRLAMTSPWPDNCDANTWQVISNSLDIDFIHGNIHGRSCKNAGYINVGQQNRLKMSITLLLQANVNILLAVDIVVSIVLSHWLKSYSDMNRIFGYDRSGHFLIYKLPLVFLSSITQNLLVAWCRTGNNITIFYDL